MKHSLSCFLLSILLLPLLLSCSDDCNECTEPEITAKYITPEEMLQDVKNQIDEISIDSLRSKLDREEVFYLIDVRLPEEFEAGTIDAALNIPRGILDLKIYKQIPEISIDDEIVLFCKSGNRSAMAAMELERIGFKHVSSMIGGYLGWIED